MTIPGLHPWDNTERPPHEAYGLDRPPLGSGFANPNDFQNYYDYQGAAFANMMQQQQMHEQLAWSYQDTESMDDDEYAPFDSATSGDEDDLPASLPEPEPYDTVEHLILDEVIAVFACGMDDGSSFMAAHLLAKLSPGCVQQNRSEVRQLLARVDPFFHSLLTGANVRAQDEWAGLVALDRISSDYDLRLFKSRLTRLAIQLDSGKPLDDAMLAEVVSMGEPVYLTRCATELHRFTRRLHNVDRTRLLCRATTTAPHWRKIFILYPYQAPRR